ncbi:MAG: hypothetical protein LBG69_01175 [Zoogloeaceae bacterium]|jgi:hypothetical protein|nr:hypothetical protein [Zoogloeaceae bacterium]
MKFARGLFFRLSASSAFCLALAALGGCEQLESRLGLENPARKAARLEAEGKAVGGACRQSGRAIEDCYSIYTWVPKEAIFSGWLEMDQYMRENKLDTIAPLLPPAPPPESGIKKKKKTVPPEHSENAPAENNETRGGAEEKNTDASADSSTAAPPSAADTP